MIFVSKSQQPVTIIGAHVLCLAPIMFLSLGFHIDGLDAQTNKLTQQTAHQYSLLRELTIPDGLETSGNITISSDKPAWIFINDQLISASPACFVKGYLLGNTQSKLRACPTWHMMNPSDNISWNKYWSSASDGTCREPSREEQQALIEQGLAKEIITDTTDEYSISYIEYGPEIILL